MSLHSSLVNYVGKNSDKGPSPALWSRVPLAAIEDPNQGVHFFDDFLSFGGTVAANVGKYASSQGQWISYEHTGGSITQRATEVNGVIGITTDNSDNDEMWMMPGGTASVLGKISDTAGDDLLLIFEARVSLAQLVTQNIFVGLSEEGLAAADTITDADDPADKDFIGFHIDGDVDNDLWTFTYNKAGGGGITTKIASLHKGVADHVGEVRVRLRSYGSHFQADQDLRQWHRENDVRYGDQHRCWYVPR